MLKISDLHIPFKQQRLSAWREKEDSTIHYPKETLYRLRSKAKGREKTCHVNKKQKKGGVVILISKWTLEKEILPVIKRDITIEKLNYQEEVMILNVYVANFRVSKYMKPKLTKLKTERNPQLCSGNSTSLCQYLVEEWSENH